MATIRFSFSDVAALRQVANYYMKMRLCHEVDRSHETVNVVFFDFNPLVAVQKIKNLIGNDKQKAVFVCLDDLFYSYGKNALDQEHSPLSLDEICLLTAMLNAAVNGFLNEFMIEGFMPEITILRHSSIVFKNDEMVVALLGRMSRALGRLKSSGVDNA